MSRANEPAVPVLHGSQNSATGETTMWQSYGGLTIREHASLEFAKAIVSSGRQGSSVVLDVAAEAREYADAWLDEMAKEPRS